MAAPALQAPGEMANWPTLRFIYATDADRIAGLLPVGITPGAEPHVHIHVYQVPVGGEPEFGVVVKVPANFDGTEGFYTLGIGIDQEQAIFISRELNGQPKFPCSIKYHRIGSTVSARSWHQGNTFLEISGEMGDDNSYQGP
jgi:acetoacetate decarboxylase